MLDAVTIMSCIEGTTVINPNIVAKIPKYFITREVLFIFILVENLTKKNPKLTVKNSTPKMAYGLAVLSAPFTANGVSKLLI